MSIFNALVTIRNTTDTYT